MRWWLALHIIFMVTWFSGLFYLPRLYVYHVMSNDQVSIDRFKVMERKLLWGITTPGAVLTTLFGDITLHTNFEFYMQQPWMIIKLSLIVVLWVYHAYLAWLWWKFEKDQNQHGHVFYRWLNEFPVLILVGVVILAIIKPAF